MTALFTCNLLYLYDKRLYMAITKNILPVVVGTIASLILIRAGEWGIHFLYPLPPGTDLHNMGSLGNAIRQMPAGAFIALLANYAFAAFAGGVVASLVSNRVHKVPAIVVGIVLTVAGLMNAVMLPNPVWFKIANLFIYLPLAYMGYLLVRKELTDADNPEITANQQPI
jgi:hypothetical protein